MSTFYYSPATDTTELPAWKRGPRGHVDTVVIPVIDGEIADPDEIDETTEMPFPWVLRPVVTRYSTRRARLARRWRRFLRSEFVADVRRRYGWALEVLGAVTVAYAAIVVLRGAWFAASLLGLVR